MAEKFPDMLVGAGTVLTTEQVDRVVAAGAKFIVSPGLNPKNVRDYLAYDRILACGGSWMVKGDLIKAGEFDKIREMVKEAVEIVKK